MMKYGLAGILVLTLVGCASTPENITPLSVEFVIAESAPSAGLTERTILGSDQKVYLSGEPVLTRAHIASAEAVTSSFGPQIEVVLTPEGRDLFARMTRENIGKSVAILVDGDVVSAPIIRDRILGGKAVIHGDFTPADADRIAKGITGQ